VPRLPLVDPDDPDADPRATGLLKAIRAGLEKREDLPWQDINVYRAMANHPGALGGLLAFGESAYRGGSLSPAHQELAYLGASVANDCHY
jgi:alkylhydroperoxidase family enzyme